MPGVRSRYMPIFARFGASRPFGTAMFANSFGRRSTRSCSPLRNASQRGCGSSMIETSTRSTIVRRWLAVVVLLAEIRVALEHHARGTLPEREPEGTGAHGVLGDLVAVGFRHLARDRARDVAVR